MVEQEMLVKSLSLKLKEEREIQKNKLKENQKIVDV